MLRKGFGAVDSAFETCVTIIDVLCGILSILRHAGGRFVRIVLGKHSRKATMFEKVLGTLSHQLQLL